MTGRVQSLRSSVAGNRPTGRQPGELYVNFADAQLGVVNATNAAQDLIAVTFYSTAANYVVGQFVIQGGQLYRCVVANAPGAFNPAQWAQIGGSIIIGDAAPTNPQPGTLWWDSVGGQLYVWFTDANSSQWVVAINVAGLLQPASTTVLGGVKVDGTTVTAAGDGTITARGIAEAPTDGKLYSRQNSSWTPTIVPMGDNRIINGDMRIDQRNGGTSGTASGLYTVDRWYFGNVAGLGTWGRNLNAGTPPPGFSYYLGFASQTAHTSAAGDVMLLSQSIEADMISDFAFGSTNAQPVTLSFWAWGTVAGTYSGSIRNYAGTRSYPFTFSVSAGAWTKTIITIPGDTGGTWVLQGNAGALSLSFDLGCGSTYRGSAGAWAASSFVGVTGAFSVVSAASQQFFVTGVKLEIGSVATPYNRQSLAKSLADCQRYYSIASARFAGYTVSGSAVGASNALQTTMRAAPTLVGNWTTLTNLGTPSIFAIDNGTFGFQAVATATGATVQIGTYTASAEL
jgi:hypothetical protein